MTILSDTTLTNTPIVCYENIVTVNNIEASSVNPSYPASNLANPATSVLWKAAATTNPQYVTVTTDGVTAVDYIAVGRHNFHTAGCTVTVQTLAGSTWTDRLSKASTLFDDGPLIFKIASIVCDGIRLKLAGATVIPQAAVVYAGRLLELQRKIYVGHTPLLYGDGVKVVNGQSENYNFTGRIVQATGKRSAVSSQNLTPDWYRQYFVPFQESAKEFPFFFAWRPLAYPGETGYCWMTGDVKVTNQRSNGMMQVDFSIAGIVS